MRLSKIFAISVLVAISLPGFAVSKLNGTLSIRCKGVGPAYSFVKLPLKSGESIEFEFMIYAATTDKTAEFSAQKCMNGSCISGTGHATFEHYKWDREASGVLEVQFPDGSISTKFEATARPRIKGYCE